MRELNKLGGKSEVKGSVLKIIEKFVKEEKGEENYKKWLDELPEESRKIYSGNILSLKWYPFDAGYTQAIKKISELFLENDINNLQEYSNFAADTMLKGIYKIYLKISSPKKTAKTGKSFLPMIYKPTSIEIDECGDENKVIFRITEFPEWNKYIQRDMKNWFTQAGKILGCINPEVKIGKSLLKGDDSTEFIETWESVK